MLIAVGMYLPFDTSSAIFCGGLFKAVADRIAARRDEAARAGAEEKGTLVASGLIAGEAITGILLATLVVLGAPSLSKLLTGTEAPAFYAAWGGWLSLAGFAALAYMLVAIPLKGRKQS